MATESSQFRRVVGKLKQTNIADGTANDKRLTDGQRLPFSRCLIELLSLRVILGSKDGVVIDSDESARLPAPVWVRLDSFDSR